MDYDQARYPKPDYREEGMSEITIEEVLQYRQLIGTFDSSFGLPESTESKIMNLAISQSETIKSMGEEIEGLHATMMAAAVEIQEHWDAHCDADGYGPANLMRRLEKGYGEAGYALTAKDWIAVQKRVEYLDAELSKVKQERDEAYKEGQADGYEAGREAAEST